MGGGRGVWVDGILREIAEGRVSLVKIAIWLTALTIINGVYGNMGSQAVVTFARIYRFINGEDVILKQPVLVALAHPTVQGYLRREVNRLKRHVHAVLESLANMGYLEYDGKRSRFIINNTTPLWYHAKRGDVYSLYKVITRIVLS